MTCPDISREEIVNACGVDDLHDGVNYTRTACVIAVSKARDMFEPFLHQVRRAAGALAGVRPSGCGKWSHPAGLLVRAGSTGPQTAGLGGAQLQLSN